MGSIEDYHLIFGAFKLVTVSRLHDLMQATEIVARGQSKNIDKVYTSLTAIMKKMNNQTGENVKITEENFQIVKEQLHAVNSFSFILALKVMGHIEGKFPSMTEQEEIGSLVNIKIDRDLREQIASFLKEKAKMTA